MGIRVAKPSVAADRTSAIGCDGRGLTSPYAPAPYEDPDGDWFGGSPTVQAVGWRSDAASDAPACQVGRGFAAASVAPMKASQKRVRQSWGSRAVHGCSRRRFQPCADWNAGIRRGRLNRPSDLREAFIVSRPGKKLTDKAVRGALPEGWHLDGDGLYLIVAQTGARSWIYRVRIDGRRREIGLGSLLDVSLVDARLARDAAKVAIAEGRDPVAERRTGAAGDQALVTLSGDRTEAADASASLSAGAPTLRESWVAYVATQAGAWRGRKTKEGWMRSIDRHAASIKDKPVDRIDAADVLEVVQAIWLTKAESAGKLRERLERVLDFARFKGHRTGENPARWKGNLVYVLPPRPKLQRGHMPAIPFEDLPALMVKLSNSKGMSARALEFTILTVARETMTLEATWDEVDGAMWSLGALRMKEKPFRQPLSKGARAVLDAIRLRSAKPTDLIFPGPKGGVMSNMAMDMLLRDLAPGFTPHGMRSSFRDWAGDETDFAKEVIEACMAHTVGDETERAYRRRDALRKRQAVLEAWSDFCLSDVAKRPRAKGRGSEVDPISARAAAA
jgi:integrase